MLGSLITIIYFAILVAVIIGSIYLMILSIKVLKKVSIALDIWISKNEKESAITIKGEWK